MAGETTDTAAEQLIATARELGYPVTRAQLARWHRADLLPRPRRQSLGRGFGMVSLYPAGSAGQLLRLSELHQQERRLPHLAFELWWEGYPVPVDAARRFLIDVGGQFDELIRQVREMDRDALRAEAERMATARVSSKAIRKMRKRVGAGNFPRLALALAETLGNHSALLGVTGLSDPVITLESSGSLVDKALGLQRARTEHLPGLPPWLPPDGATETMGAIRDLIAGVEFRELAKETTPEQLQSTKTAAAAFISYLVPLAQLVTDRFGKGMFGMTVFGELLGGLTIEDKAGVLLAVLAFRSDAKFDQGLQALAQLSGEFEKHAKTQQLLNRVQAEIPALAKQLRPARQRAALRSPEAAARHLQEVRHVVDTHRSEIDALLARNPDLAALWAEVVGAQVVSPPVQTALGAAANGEPT